jgi:hypothetical protein
VKTPIPEPEVGLVGWGRAKKKRFLVPFLPGGDVVAF